MISRHVAVVGGGLAGLAAAYRLRVLLGPSVRITVLDQSPTLGGKLRTDAFAGTSFDVGAEAFLVRRPEAIELITELGLLGDLVHPAGRPSMVRAGGQTVRLPGRTVFGVPGDAETVRPVLSPAGFAAVSAEPSLPPISLDGGDVSVGELLRARFGPELGARLVDPLLGGVYAGQADNLGLRATMPAVASALDAGAGSLLAAANTMLPPPRPDNEPMPPVFGTLRGGLGGLVERLRARALVDTRLGCLVRDLSRTEHGWRLGIGPASGAGGPVGLGLDEIMDVDGVVLAVPPPAARRLLGGVCPAAATAFGEIELASTALIALALPAEIELPQVSGVLIGSGERHVDGTPFAAKAFTFSSRKWEHFAGESVLVRGSVGRFGAAEQLQVEDAELVRAVRADLAELTGVTATPVASAVIRWGGALPQYGVGHVDLVARIEGGVATMPGLALAGAALHGVGIPACIATGHAAASQIAAHVLERQRRGWPAATPSPPAS